MPLSSFFPKMRSLFFASQDRFVPCVHRAARVTAAARRASPKQALLSNAVRVAFFKKLDVAFSGKMDEASIEGRLDSIERKLDRVLAMLSPVHSHAEWVDGLRARLHGLGLVSDVPRISSA